MPFLLKPNSLPSTPAQQRVRRRRRSLIVATLAALALALLAFWQGSSALRFTAALRDDRVASLLVQRLPPLIAAGDIAGVQALSRSWLADPALDLRYLAITTSDGRALSVLGQYEDRGAWLPQAAGDWLRRQRYRLEARFYTRAIAAPTGAVLGEARYAVGDSLTTDIHDQALRRLLASAFLSLLLAGIAAVMIRRGWQRSAVVPAGWLRRIDPGQPVAPPSAFSAAEVEARVTEALYQRAGALLDEVGQGLILTDRDAGIRYLNDTAARLTGWAAADLRGRPVYSAFHVQDERYTPLTTPAELSLRDLTAQPPAELRLRARDGSQLPVEVMAVPLRSPTGAAEGALMLFRDISEREARVDQWRRQARLSLGVVDHLVEGVLTTDPAGVVRFANARALRMFGYAREELGGVTVSKLMPVPFLNSPSVRLSDYVGAAHSALPLPKVLGWRRDATTFPVDLLVLPMTVDQSEGLLLIVRDLTERLRSDNLTQRLGRVLDAASEEIYIFDAQTLRFVEVNRGARRNLGYHPSEMTQMTPLTVSQELDADTFSEHLGRLRSGELEYLSYRCRHRRADGSSYPVEVRLNYSREEEPPVFVAIAVDITEREEAEQKLRFLAHHDSLTGLPNRATLHDRLSQAVAAADRSHRLVGVLYMDVDRFKHINDTYGHETGDQVLKQVAQRLSGLLRVSDTVARLGGDEFVVIAAGLRNADSATALAAKIAQSFAEPMHLPELSLRVSLSIGIALYPADESNAEGLLQHADQMMYQAKRAGGGQQRLFEAEVAPERQRRMDLERGIHTALALQQLSIEFTPLMQGSAVRAARVDLHWQHPRYGRIGSAEVFLAASRTSLAGDLELWRLKAALDAIAAGHAGEQLPLALEISAWQLRDREFGEQALQLAQQAPEAAGRLIVCSTREGLQALPPPYDQGPLAQWRAAAALRFGLLTESDAVEAVDAIEAAADEAFADLALRQHGEALLGPDGAALTAAAALSPQAFADRLATQRCEPL